MCSSKFFFFIAGVVDTSDKLSFAKISAKKFAKKFEMVLMGYLGARGTLIHEKNLKLKISCQTLFKFQNCAHGGDERRKEDKYGTWIKWSCKLYLEGKVQLDLIPLESITYRHIP